MTTTAPKKSQPGAGNIIYETDGVRERELWEDCNGCHESFLSVVVESKTALVPQDYASSEAVMPGAMPNDVAAADVAEAWYMVTQTRYCERCVEAARKAAEPMKHEERLAKVYNALTPAFYRSPAIKAAMKAQAPGKAEACTELVKEGEGVLAFGETGHFKTTAMFLGPIRWLVWNGRRPLYIRANEWRQQTSAAAKECELEKFLKPFKTIPWLFLDDIGHMNGTPSAEEGLLEVLEVRMQEGLPVLATTQYDTAGLMARFSTPEKGAAICRRLALLAKPIAF